MNYSACCTDLESLIAAPKNKSGLGIMIVLAKWGTSFILEYREDWSLPVSGAGVRITYCPFCGAKLDRPSS
jgi:hypothetical protein